MTSEKISTRNASDPYDNGLLGDLTEKQYAALETVARLSPGYFFTVLRYHGGPSSKATHVGIRRAAVDSSDEAGLVGHDCAQYRDGLKETERVVMRVAHRVYRKSVYFL